MENMETFFYNTIPKRPMAYTIHKEWVSEVIHAKRMELQKREGIKHRWKNFGTSDFLQVSNIYQLSENFVLSITLTKPDTTLPIAREITPIKTKLLQRIILESNRNVQEFVS
jgi:hypothetical protein